MNMQLLSNIVCRFNSAPGNRHNNIFLDCFSALALDQPLNIEQKKALAGAIVGYVETCPQTEYPAILEIAKQLDFVSILIPLLGKEIELEKKKIQTLFCAN